MILEPIRMVTDWLADEDNGVNTHLLTIDVDADDQAPTPVRLVADETRDDWVARKDTPVTHPALVITMDAPFTMARKVATGQYREADDVVVAIRYIRSDHETAAAIRDTLYTLRAVVSSIEVLMGNDNLPARTRNQVCITDLTSISQLLVFEAVGNSAVTGAVLLSLEVRDLDP